MWAIFRTKPTCINARFGTLAAEERCGSYYWVRLIDGRRYEGPWWLWRDLKSFRDICVIDTWKECVLREAVVRTTAPIMSFAVAVDYGNSFAPSSYMSSKDASPLLWSRNSPIFFRLMLGRAKTGVTRCERCISGSESWSEFNIPPAERRFSIKRLTRTGGYKWVI